MDKSGIANCRNQLERYIMICYNPIPLFEASLFPGKPGGRCVLEFPFWSEPLVREKAACTARPCHPTQNSHRAGAAASCQHHGAGCHAPEALCPLYHKGNDQRHPSAGHVCSILLPGLAEAYLDWEAADFFHASSSKPLGTARANFGHFESESCDAGENLSIQQLFQAINGSDLPQSSKLILTDLALNGEQYVDLLQDALTPVARSFKDVRS